MMSMAVVTIVASILAGPIGGPEARPSQAADDQAWLRQQFDQQITPLVASALAEPISNDRGSIAWGRSYELAALAEMLEATRDARYAEMFVKLGRQVVDARDDHHDRRDVLRNRVVAAWGSTKYSGGKHCVWAVHTGMIAAPMAHFAAIVRSDKTLAKRFGNDADFFLNAAAEAVAVHDDQYREGPGPDEGYVYGLLLDKPLPLNQQNALARAWIYLDDATGSTKHRERIVRLAHFLKHRLRTTDDGAYVWAYWAPLDGPGDGFEDISHAAINVDFMVLCFARGLVFTKDDLARLDKTLLDKVILGDDAVANTVGGTGGENRHAGQILRWSRLARYSEPVRRRLMALSRSGKLAVANPASNPAGLAILYSASKAAATRPARDSR